MPCILLHLQIIFKYFFFIVNPNEILYFVLPGFCNNKRVERMSYSRHSRGAQGSANNAIRVWAVFLCVASFWIGMTFTDRIWKMIDSRNLGLAIEKKSDLLKLTKCATNTKQSGSGNIYDHTWQREDAILKLDEKISNLETEIATARTQQDSLLQSRSAVSNHVISETNSRPKMFVVIGISTAFSSRKRRDSIRATWMPQGEKLKKLEKKKGVIARFVIGHSATPGGILDQAIESEASEFKDFMRLNHIEGFDELSEKTKIYFATAFATWDAEFYIKMDDDVHVNLATLGKTLATRVSRRRVYIGCMKSGPILSQRGVRYNEPEYWKFGEVGNKYFLHATGQLYGISKDLAAYITKNKHILHNYANEDVSLGAWFIGLDVQHIDDRRLCCGTGKDCESKAKGGNMCVASFDWKCHGLCHSAERMNDVHQRCGEGDQAIWSATLPTMVSSVHE